MFSSDYPHPEGTNDPKGRFERTMGNLDEDARDRFYRRNVGVRLGISMLFGGGNRANADYRSRTGTFRSTVSRGAEDHVGSWGYDAGVSDSRGDTSADASINYVGNRFDARATVFTRGNGIGGVTDRQRARLQVGTAVAFADGAFGIGRPVSDSFAVIEPHPAIKDREVITGRNLRNDKYDARSGVFGGTKAAPGMCRPIISIIIWLELAVP